MNVAKALSLMVLLVGVGSLGGCAMLQDAKQSDAFKKFCDWGPVAITGIEQAAVDAAKDPVKLRVAQAMREASGYLKLVAVQCQAPVMAIK